MFKVLLSVILLISVVSVITSQVNCFYGTSQQNGNSETVNTKPIACPGNSFCMKTYQKNYNYNNYQTNSYGCGTEACTRGGCRENKNGYGTCCCRENYCNSGLDFSKTATSSIILTLVSVLFI